MRLRGSQLPNRTRGCGRLRIIGRGAGGYPESVRGTLCGCCGAKKRAALLCRLPHPHHPDLGWAASVPAGRGGSRPPRSILS